MNLQIIDKFTRKFGLVNDVINMVMNKVLPQAIAAACHPNPSLYCLQSEG
ncbi:MAG: hypothetical protein M5U34_04220 [Chloroflexi bacterium]|nr:hypothetical protein [Chloroflexota bacterium]